MPRFLNDTFLDNEAGSVRIILSDRDRVSFFHEEGILCSVDGGINSQGKDVLMMRREDLIVNHGSVRNAFFVHGSVDGLCRRNARCTDFEMNICCLTELPCLNVSHVATGTKWGREGGVARKYIRSWQR